jgi:O-antigen ligase
MQLSSDKIIKFILFLTLAAVFILPQLNNIHYDPLPQFWAEMTVAWLTLALFVLVVMFLPKISLPPIIFPLLIFAIYLSIQQFWVKIDFIGLSYIASLEFCLCILAAISLNSLSNIYGKKTVITIIAYSFLLGAILQTIIGFIQYTGTYRYFNNLIFYDSLHPTTNIFGHFGQRNHYCDYISIAIFGLIYLFTTKKVKSAIFVPILVWLVFSLTIAASRSVFIYFFSAFILCGLFYFFDHNSTLKRNIFITLTTTSLFLVAFEYTYPLLEQIFLHHPQINSGIERIASDYSASGITGRRLVEWQKAWLIFIKNPIFGYGFNEFSKQSVLLQHLFPHVPENDGLFTNCHNLILQLLAETGIIGTIILSSGIGYAIYLLARNQTVEDLIILCMFFTIFLHSMVEYPLWYIYFLAPLVMFLALTKSSFTLKNNTMIVLTGAPIVFIIYLMVQGSIIFSTLVYYNDPPDNSPDFRTQAIYLKNLAATNVLWRYPAYYALDNYINVDDANTNKTFSLKNQLKFEEEFTGFHPYPDNLIKLAKLNWILGNKNLALEQVNLALVAYPVYQSSYIKSLTEKHGKYAPLLKIAQNYSYN